MKPRSPTRTSSNDLASITSTRPLWLHSQRTATSLARHALPQKLGGTSGNQTAFSVLQRMDNGGIINHHHNFSLIIALVTLLTRLWLASAGRTLLLYDRLCIVHCCHTPAFLEYPLALLTASRWVFARAASDWDVFFFPFFFC